MADIMVINYVEVRPYDDERDVTGRSGESGDVRYLVEATTPEEFEEDGADASGPVMAERLVHPKERGIATCESIHLFRPRLQQMPLGWRVAPHLMEAAREIEGMENDAAWDLLYGRQIVLE